MNHTSHTRPRQRDRLLALLKSRAPDLVSLPDIIALGIAQYNARIFELRRLGHHIESKQKGSRSWFRLVTASAPSPVPESRPVRETPAKAESLFGDLSPDRSYRE
jgi:Helix-turn-helix domain